MTFRPPHPAVSIVLRRRRPAALPWWGWWLVALLSCTGLGSAVAQDADEAPREIEKSPRFLRPIPDPGRWREFKTHRFDPALTDAQREQIEQLEAIGYLAGSQAARDGVGVVFHDPSRAQPGANVYTSGHAPEAVLIDMDGEVLHRWRYDFWQAWPDFPIERDHPMSQFWRRTYLFENGDLLAIHEGLGLLRLDRDSKLRWALSNRAHHDVKVLANGEILTLAREAHLVPRVNPDEPILEDFVERIHPDGRTLQRFSLLEAFEGTDYADLVEIVVGRRGDIFHTNSLHVLGPFAQAEHPAFREGNLLVYMLAIGVVAVVDPGSEKVVWGRAGHPLLRHDPRVLENGNLMIFENHAGADRSRVVEYASVSREVHWTFEGTEENAFFSNTCGTAARLPNGNTLVVESDGGRALEVTPDHAIVWAFHSPHRAGPEDRYVATLFDLVRLSPSFPLDWTQAAQQRAASAP